MFVKDFKQYKDTVYQIIGAAMNVHDELSWGLLEPVYNEALHLELLDNNIANEREKHLPCYYKHHQLEKEELSSAHRAQLFNYLRLTRKPIGLLINFGQPSLQGERYGYDEVTNECILLNKNMEPVYAENYMDN